MFSFERYQNLYYLQTGCKDSNNFFYPTSQVKKKITARNIVFQRNLAVEAGLPSIGRCSRFASGRTRGGFSSRNIVFQRNLAVEAGFEPAVQLPVRQFSKLVVSATHPLHLNVP